MQFLWVRIAFHLKHHRNTSWSHTIVLETVFIALTIELATKWGKGSCT